MKTILAVTLFLASLNVVAASAGDKDLSRDPKYLTVQSVQVRDVTNRYPRYVPSSTESLGINVNPIDRVDVIVDKIINIGTKIWNIVERGRPVVNYNSVAANALPENTLRWEQLANWQAPRSKVMEVTYKNLLGMEVVKFVYRIVLLSGGSVNGTGKYIGYAKVEPVELSVAWLYTMNATAGAQSVFNMGTTRAPLAGMILNVGWTVETVLKRTTVTHTYNLDGRGNISVPSTSSINLLK